MFFSRISTVFKTKALSLIITTLLLVSGATVVLATPLSPQHGAPLLASSASTASATVGHKPEVDQEDDNTSQGENSNCFTLDDLQEWLTRFHLSAEKTSAAMKAICPAHAHRPTCAQYRGLGHGACHSPGPGRHDSMVGARTPFYDAALREQYESHSDQFCPSGERDSGTLWIKYAACAARRSSVR